MILAMKILKLGIIKERWRKYVHLMTEYHSFSNKLNFRTNSMTALLTISKHLSQSFGNENDINIKKSIFQRIYLIIYNVLGLKIVRDFNSLHVLFQKWMIKILICSDNAILVDQIMI